MTWNLSRNIKNKWQMKVNSLKIGGMVTDLLEIFMITSASLMISGI